MLKRAIDRFTDWFTSAAAFAQGTVVTLAWLVVVFSGVADRNGWWLLFALTVFSGVTQFPLAYAARRAAEASDRALGQISEATGLLVQLAENETNLQEAAAAQSAAIVSALAELRRHLNRS